MKPSPRTVRPRIPDEPRRAGGGVRLRTPVLATRTGVAAGRNPGHPAGPADDRVADQNWSALTTSPPLRVPRFHQVVRLIELLMKRTLPSPIATLTPPGCALLAGTVTLSSGPQWPTHPESSRQPLPRYCESFGTWRWLNIELPMLPMHHRY